MLSWLIVWLVQGAFEFGFAKLFKVLNFNKKGQLTSFHSLLVINLRLRYLQRFLMQVASSVGKE